MEASFAVHVAIGKGADHAAQDERQDHEGDAKPVEDQLDGKMIIGNDDPADRFRSRRAACLRGQHQAKDHRRRQQPDDDRHLHQAAGDAFAELVVQQRRQSQDDDQQQRRRDDQIAKQLDYRLGSTLPTFLLDAALERAGLKRGPKTNRGVQDCSVKIKCHVVQLVPITLARRLISRSQSVRRRRTGLPTGRRTPCRFFAAGLSGLDDGKFQVLAPTAIPIDRRGHFGKFRGFRLIGMELILTKHLDA